VFAFAIERGRLGTWISFRDTYYDLNGLNKKETKIIDLFFTE